MGTRIATWGKLMSSRLLEQLLFSLYCNTVLFNISKDCFSVCVLLTHFLSFQGSSKPGAAMTHGAVPASSFVNDGAAISSTYFCTLLSASFPSTPVTLLIQNITSTCERGNWGLLLLVPVLGSLIISV